MNTNSFDHLHNVGHLTTGNPRQQSAYETLMRYQVIERLKAYEALLAGTVPIAVDIESSDLDIICCYTNAAEFEAHLVSVFGACSGFRSFTTVINNEASVVANFKLDGWKIEVFGQAISVKQQNAYRHMIAEYILLQKHGDSLRQQVVQLKQQGCKTEPAFAKALSLKGDPYQALLDLYPF